MPTISGFESQKTIHTPESQIHGANMGPIWGRQDPGGPHVGPMDFAIWVPHGQQLVKLD